MLLSAFWFLLAALLFYFAIREPPGYFRYVLGILHLFSTIRSLTEDSFIPSPYSEIWVLFAITSGLHAFTILFTQGKVVGKPSTGLKDDLRETFWAWSNFRRLPFTERDVTPPINNGVVTTRVLFATTRVIRILILWLINRSITSLAFASILRLGITIEDFSPEKQSLLPPVVPRDLFLRTIISFHWILSDYCIITLAYDVFSVLFVSILRWDAPPDWPCLFGSIAEAYSLRRFWGIFWHKLHVEAIIAYMPRFQYWRGTEYWWQTSAEKSLRALWIFLFSGVCHGLVHLVLQRNMMRQEIRFFLSNYIVCLAETVATSVIWRRPSHDVGLNIWLRILGYLWVLCFFFCTSPAWKYPLVYNFVVT